MDIQLMEYVKKIYSFDTKLIRYIADIERYYKKI